MESFKTEAEVCTEIVKRRNSGKLGMLYMNMQLYTRQVQPVVDRVVQYCKEQEWASKYVYGVRVLGDELFLFVHLEDKELAPALARMKSLTNRLKEGLKLQLEGVHSTGGAKHITINGHLMDTASTRDPELLLYMSMKRLVCSYQAAAKEEELERLEEFQRILDSRSVRSVYQPIVALSDATVYGYEALTRGPENSPFHAPLELFQFAENHGALHVLDRLAREKAIEGCKELRQDQRVFINIPSDVIHDPQFAEGITLKALQKHGIHPHNVVLELTERSSIEDFHTAKRVLEHYRKQGYQIAIDDAGAGYSSLQAIAELQPDFIKVDKSLIRNIHKDKVKEMLLETFVSFARKMSIRIIAEGIEDWEELKKLSQMGVHYGQGYLLCRPAPKLTGIEESIVHQMERSSHLGLADPLLQVGSLAQSIPGFQQWAPVSEIVTCLKQNEECPGAVILKGDTPVGLIMREKLFQKLAGQYGVSLYWNKPIEQLMDHNPLIVDVTTPIEKVSQMAMSREKNHLYDPVVLVSKKRLAGVASIQALLEAITSFRVESARFSNPLTGLPGNVTINRELNKRLFEGEPFSVIYADLDYFKWFNDRYGFQKGDELIQYTADVLQQSLSACGSPLDFLGHVGGDDFILISEVAQPDQLCEEIIRRFRQGVELLYEEDAESSVQDRYGKEVDGGGLHISLSLIICQCGGAISPGQISEAAARLKKQAKAQIGSVWFSTYLGNEELRVSRELPIGNLV